MHIDMKVDGVTVSVEVEDVEDYGTPLENVVDILVEPALLALGYHPDSIQEIFASYANPSDTFEDDVEGDELEGTYNQGFIDGYDQGLTDGEENN